MVLQCVNTRHSLHGGNGSQPLSTWATGVSDRRPGGPTSVTVVDCSTTPRALKHALDQLIPETRAR
jgi:hypothetical protein